MACVGAGPSGTIAGPPRLSVIVPARDAAGYLPRTLPALLAALPPSSELIVCDDGSRDGSAEIAAALGCRVERSARPEGAAAARNRGAALARGEILVFVDADVRVRPETLPALLAPLLDAEIAAAFGSYDADPPPVSTVSRYKNLAHHFVHQRSRPEASTFWSGCGAIRADVFRAVGGFDAAIAGIEDVELGYRLRERGYRVRLVHGAQVTHLKEWTVVSWLRSDLLDRALPWARLVRAGRGLPGDLNFRPGDRAAAALTVAAAVALLASPLDPRLIVPAVLAAGTALAFDFPLLAFFARHVSAGFAVRAAGLHLLHRLAGATGFALGLLLPPARSRLL